MEINCEKNSDSSVFSLSSINGGGKSTLLQFTFIMLHCFMDERKRIYINLLEDCEVGSLAEFVIEDKGEDQILQFLISPAKDEERDYNLFPDVINRKVFSKKYSKRIRRIYQLC